MIERNYTISAATLRTLEALAYWSAEQAYQNERDPSDALELERISKTIHSLFDECDRYQISPLLVNQALYFGSNWRQYMTNYFTLWAERRGIILTVK